MKPDKCEKWDSKRHQAVTSGLHINYERFGARDVSKMASMYETMPCNPRLSHVDTRINAQRMGKLLKNCNCAYNSTKPTNHTVTRRRHSKDILQTVTVLLLLSSVGAWSVSASATVGNPPRVLKHDVNTLVAYRGQTLTLPCTVTSGKPRPRIHWYKNGIEIGKDWERFKQQRKGLRIRNAAMGDRGVYRCEAVNGYGSEELEIMLLVEVELNTSASYVASEKPIFTEPTKMRRHNFVKPAGSDVRFTCKAKGKPPPQIQWFKDGNFTNLPEGNPRRQQWSLTLRGLTMSDSGRYTCRVWNKAGAITFNYSLRVVGLFQSKPFLLKPHPVNTTVRVGEKTSLQCRIRSEFLLTVKWVKQIEPNTAHLYSEDFMNNLLHVDGGWFVVLPMRESLYLPDERIYLNKHVIKSATERDAGRYSCLAVDTRGFQLRDAYLTVLPALSSNVGSSQQRTSYKFNSLPLPLIIGLPAAAGVVIVCIVTAFCINKREDLAKFAGAVTKSGRPMVHEVYDVPSTSTAAYAAPASSRDECTEHLCCHKQIATAHVERSDIQDTSSNITRPNSARSTTRTAAKSSRVTFDTSSKEGDDHSSKYCFHEFNIHPPPPSLCSRSSVTESSVNSRKRHKPGCRRNYNRYHAYHRQQHSRRYDPPDKFSSPSYCS